MIMWFLRKLLFPLLQEIQLAFTISSKFSKSVEDQVFAGWGATCKTIMASAKH